MAANTNSSACYIAPIREDTNGNGKVLYYDNTTNEVHQSDVGFSLLNGSAVVDSDMAITSTTNSTTTTNGALTVAGGVGIATNLNVGNAIFNSTGTLILKGGATGGNGATYRLESGGNSYIDSNTLTFRNQAGTSSYAIFDSTETQLLQNILKIGRATGTSGSTIYMEGVQNDGGFDHSVIETRLYNGIDKSELLLFKGNDTIGNNLDRIRLRAGQIVFDALATNTLDRISENPVASIDHQKFDVNVDLDLSGKALLFANENVSVSSLPSTDGAIYRYQGQLELMVDDNFYIRDQGWTGTPQYTFNTGSGYYMYRGAASQKTGTAAGFKYHSSNQADRLVIHQYEDGSGAYWYWARDGTNGKNSDRRMKENIEDISKDDTDFLMRMRPKKYSLKDVESDCCHYGLIAQEVLAECKTTHQKLIVHNYEDYIKDNNTDKMLGLSYESFIPLLIKAVQDQQKEIQTLNEEKQTISQKLQGVEEHNQQQQTTIEELQATVTTLQEENASLKQRLENIEKFLNMV